MMTPLELAKTFVMLSAYFITRETTWCDIFPHPPPEGLEWCYGADKGTPPPGAGGQGMLLLH